MAPERNYIKEKLVAGKVVLGTWSMIGSSTLLEIMGGAGLDFIILDTEHGVYNMQTLEDGIRALELVECSPLVRVTQVKSDLIQNCLDMRCHGLIFPQIANAGGARQAIAACKYPPYGTRGFNPFTRAGGYGKHSEPLAQALTNSFAFNTVLVETLQAFEELDQILQIPGLDAIYLGVYDMSVQMGCDGNVNHPRIAAFLADSIQRIRQAGTVAGVMVKHQADMHKYVAMGANMLLYAVDTHLVADPIRTATMFLKQVQS